MQASQGTSMASTAGEWGARTGAHGARPQAREAGKPEGGGSSRCGGLRPLSGSHGEGHSQPLQVDELAERRRNRPVEVVDAQLPARGSHQVRHK